MDIASEIKTKIKGDVLIDSETLRLYSRDASIFEIQPKVVVCPKDVEDVKALVHFVNEKKQAGQDISLTPRAAGTDMTGGPLTESIVLDFTKHFNQIKEVGADYAIAEPGVFYRDSEKETLAHDLLLPSFPASRQLCALGGMVGNNAGGEKTLMYGETKEFVRELKVVLADGNEYVFGELSRHELEQKMQQGNLEGKVYKNLFSLIQGNERLIRSLKPNVSKNSAGYNIWDVWNGTTFNMAKIFTGSQGTLGIVTEIKFRLVKPKKYTNLLIVFLSDLKSLSRIVNVVLGFKPEALESYDHHTLSLAIKFFPDLVKRLKTSFFRLLLKFWPEFLMMIRGGLPHLVMLAEFTGDSLDEARTKALEAQQLLQKLNVTTRVTTSDLEAEKYRIIRRESFNLLRHHVQGKQTVPAFEDIIVKPEYLPDFLPQVESILNEYDFIYTIQGHVGDGHFHIIPLMDLSDLKSHQIIPEVAERIFDLVFKYHGSISAEHSDGIIRSPYLEKMYGAEVYDLFVQVKNIFDPQNIFNPGKKVGATKEYALAHIKHGA